MLLAPMTNPSSFCHFVPTFGLHTISVVRASGLWFGRFVFDASESVGEACSLNGQLCWHPVLPDPAPPPRRALQPDPLVVCPGFGLDRWIT